MDVIPFYMDFIFFYSLFSSLLCCVHTLPPLSIYIRIDRRKCFYNAFKQIHARTQNVNIVKTIDISHLTLSCFIQPPSPSTLNMNRFFLSFGKKTEAQCVRTRVIREQFCFRLLLVSIQFHCGSFLLSLSPSFTRFVSLAPFLFKLSLFQSGIHLLFALFACTSVHHFSLCYKIIDKKSCFIYVCVLLLLCKHFFLGSLSCTPPHMSESLCVHSRHSLGYPVCLGAYVCVHIFVHFLTSALISAVNIIYIVKRQTRNIQKPFFSLSYYFS